MKHYVSPRLWALYEALPKEIRDLADKNYELLKADPRHPSLHFKKLGKHWSVRVGAHYRALAVDVEGGPYWFWVRWPGFLAFRVENLRLIALMHIVASTSRRRRK